jgi:hypothetical protein
VTGARHVGLPAVGVVEANRSFGLLLDKGRVGTVGRRGDPACGACPVKSPACRAQTSQHWRCSACFHGRSGYVWWVGRADGDVDLLASLDMSEGQGPGIAKQRLSHVANQR